MNCCLMLTRNCLSLTKKCVASVMAQDIPVRLLIIDNGSTDGTIDWLESPEYRCLWAGTTENEGVSKGWNRGLTAFFADGAEYVLVLNNDTVITPNMYRLMLDYNAPFVTGASFGDLDAVMKGRDDVSPLTPGPDFSCFLIRKEAWNKVGPFDERMVHYAGDNDWHVRAHRAGVFLGNSHIPFYHERSSTLKLASPEDQMEIQRQADLDRQVFYEKYGCHTWTPQYKDLFIPQPVETE